MWTPPSSLIEPSAPITNVSIRFRRYSRKSGNTAARESGLRFEDQVQTEMLERFELDYHPEPHLMYWTGKGPRNGFPDGLMLLNDRTVVFEIKVQHMPEAWWQLRRHYQLVLEQYRPVPVQCCEIVKTYDAGMPFPEEGLVLFERDFLGKFLQADPKQMGVLLW